MAYILSPQAQDSLRSIHAYTLNNYGKKQTKLYVTLLRNAMRSAAKNPRSEGTERDDIKQGYYFVRAGKHHIYYRIRDTHIDIIDILHLRMEPTLHL